MPADPDGYARAGEALLATGMTAFQPTFITAPEATSLPRCARCRPTASARASSARTSRARSSRPQRLGVHDRREPPRARPRAAAPAARRRPGEPDDARARAARRVRADRRAGRARGHRLGRAHRRDRRRGAPGLRPRRAHGHPPLQRDAPEHRRATPGIAMAALARADVIVQVIVDGHHFARETVLVAWQAAAGRFALVTDAVAAAAMGDGAFASAAADVGRGRRRARPGGPLAGSALTMIEAVRNLHGLGVELEDALAAAIEVPARVAGPPRPGAARRRRAGGHRRARRPPRGRARAGRGRRPCRSLGRRSPSSPRSSSACCRGGGASLPPRADRPPPPALRRDRRARLLDNAARYAQHLLGRLARCRSRSPRRRCTRSTTRRRATTTRS